MSFHQASKRHENTGYWPIVQRQILAIGLFNSPAATCKVTSPQICMDDQIVFGKNVRATRDAAGISREVAAERAGITTEYLGEIERGEKWPTLPVLRSIARAFHVSPARFFEFEDQENSATVLEKLQRTVDSRTPHEQEQALRVVKALFGL